MKALATKLLPVAKDLEAQHGPFALFGIFQHAMGAGNWDIIASAPWLEAMAKPRDFLIRAVVPVADHLDLLSIRSVDTIPPDSPFVRDVAAAYRAEGEAVKVGDVWHVIDAEFGGIPIRRGFVLRANGPATDYAYGFQAAGYSPPRSTI